MDKYTVKLLPQAARDLDEIYTYIELVLKIPENAANLIDELENAVLGLEEFPERGAYRKVGAFAGRKYRQLIVKNYTIIYKVLSDRREVHIVTVRYSASSF